MTQQTINGDDGLLNGSNLSNHERDAQRQPVILLYYQIEPVVWPQVDGRYRWHRSRTLRCSSALPRCVQPCFETLYKSSESPTSPPIELTAAHKSGGVKVSAFVPGVSSSNRQDILVRQGRKERDAATQATVGPA